MSAVALEKPLGARDALAAAIAWRAECAKGCGDARAAHAAALEGLEAAKAALDAIATSERAHGHDLAAAIKLAVAKGRQVPLLPNSPDGVERARAEAALSAGTVAVAQLAAELEQATAAHAAAEEAVKLAARDVLREEAHAITVKAERAFENLRTMQAALTAIDVAAFRPGGIGPGVLPARAARILALDMASGSTPPGQAQAALAAWREFRLALERDATVEAPGADLMPNDQNGIGRRVVMSAGRPPEGGSGLPGAGVASISADRRAGILSHAHRQMAGVFSIGPGHHLPTRAG